MSVGLGKGVLAGLIPIGGKEFLNTRWLDFVGPPPAFGGRRPCAEAAASPRRGLAAAKTSLHSESF